MLQGPKEASQLGVDLSFKELILGDDLGAFFCCQGVPFWSAKGSHQEAAVFLGPGCPKQDRPAHVRSLALKNMGFWVRRFRGSDQNEKTNPKRYHASDATHGFLHGKPIGSASDFSG